MYSFCSKAALKKPQPTSESGAAGSSRCISSRARGCAIGTNSEPAGTSRGSGFHSPSSVTAVRPSNGSRASVTCVARNVSTASARQRRGDRPELDAVQLQLLRRPTPRAPPARGSRRAAPSTLTAGTTSS